MKKQYIFLVSLFSLTVLVFLIGYSNFGKLSEEQIESAKEYNEAKEKQRKLEEKEKKKIESLKYPLLVFTFDDGTSTDYNIVYHMFKDKGIKGTSFVVGDWVNKEGFMNVDQIKEMLDGGWDIQGHTFEHKRLKELQSEEVVEQVIKNNQKFKDLGLHEPKHLALPYGQINEKDRDLVAEHRKTIRNVSSTSHGKTNEWDSIDFSSLNAVNIDTTDLKGIKEDIDFAIETNSIIILFGHEIGEGEYQTPLQTLEEITDYIVKKDIETSTIGEMYDRVIEFQDKIKQ